MNLSRTYQEELAATWRRLYLAFVNMVIDHLVPHKVENILANISFLRGDDESHELNSHALPLWHTGTPQVTRSPRADLLARYERSVPAQRALSPPDWPCLQNCWRHTCTPLHLLAARSEETMSHRGLYAEAPSMNPKFYGTTCGYCKSTGLTLSYCQHFICRAMSVG